MCLDLKWDSRQKRAKKDIVVYKVIKCFGKNFYTLYQQFEVEVGKSYSTTLVKRNRSIYEGFHSYVNFEDALNMLHSYERRVVKCIIPKGSLYYTGAHGFIPSIASNQIIYVEILNP